MKLEVALLFVLMLNMLLFMTQTSMDTIAEQEQIVSTTAYNYDYSILSQYDSGNLTVTNDVTNILPSGESSLSADDNGNFFTDIFVTMKSWLSQSTGLNYLISIVTAFPNFLKAMNLPTELTFSLGALWYSLISFLFVMVVTGRS